MDPNNSKGSAPTLGVESLVGLVVEVSQDRKVIVELPRADGTGLRCAALTTVPIDPGVVGQPVELMFLGDRLDQPVITRQLDLQAELRAQWDALGRKVLGLDPDPCKLAELIDQAGALACTAALLDAEGNLTHGAASVDTSRRRFREHVRRWKLSNPRFAPMLETFDGRRHGSRAKAQPGKDEGKPAIEASHGPACVVPRQPQPLSGALGGVRAVGAGKGKEGSDDEQRNGSM